MNKPETLCGKCGIRPATNHICYGGTGRSVDWCDECLRLGDPSTSAFTEEMKDAKCIHCGASPCCGGIDFIAQITGEGPAMRWMCVSCSTEYHTHMQAAFAEVPADLTHAMQMDFIREIRSESDTHMAEFVRRRDN